MTETAPAPRRGFNLGLIVSVVVIVFLTLFGCPRLFRYLAEKSQPTEWWQAPLTTDAQP
ncbi:hypothetical protein FACS1894139_12300 [Planctomycetales bacterium]|nr:hypothetical protein FACS1894107_02170 [Planctomycetales bacterium]GHT06445.1 hypothetical protein FACS1894139_12300 [Planctomycetales bacterium]